MRDEFSGLVQLICVCMRVVSVILETQKAGCFAMYGELLKTFEILSILELNE